MPQFIERVRIGNRRIAQLAIVANCAGVQALVPLPRIRAMIRSRILGCGAAGFCENTNAGLRAIVKAISRALPENVKPAAKFEEKGVRNVENMPDGSTIESSIPPVCVTRSPVCV